MVVGMSQNQNIVTTAIEFFGAWGGKSRYVLQQLIECWSMKMRVTRQEAALGAAAVYPIFFNVGSWCRQLERGFPEGGGGEGDEVDGGHVPLGFR